MQENVTYALIHSPLVVPFTWELVYEALMSQGLKAITPALLDDPGSSLPYWQQHVDSVAHDLAQTPSNESIALIAHSGAGPLLPAIRSRLTHSICAYIFVDAGIPRDGLSRIDLMKLEDSRWAEQFHQSLLSGAHHSSRSLFQSLPVGLMRLVYISSSASHMIGMWNGQNRKVGPYMN
jgi:hypothetical protein